MAARCKTRKELSELTKKLGFPEFGAVEKADSLVTKLMEKSGWDYIDPTDEEMDGMLLIPGYKYKGEGIGKLENPVDNYLFSATSILSAVLKLSKDLYRRNKIRFREHDFVEDKDLLLAIPDNFPFKLKTTDPSTIELGDMCLGAAERFVEAIETQFYLLENYDTRKTNPKQERYIRRKIGKIAQYAELGIEMADVLDGFGQRAEAGSLRNVMEKLKDRKSLFNSFQNNDDYPFYSELIKLHAQLNRLTLTEDAFEFYDSTGEEISLAMDIARVYNQVFHGVADTVIAKKDRSMKDRLVVSNMGKLQMIESGSKELTSGWKTNWAACIANCVGNDKRLELALKTGRAPYDGLDLKLHALGIPYGISRKISNYLKFNIGGRTIPAVLEDIGKGKSLYKTLFSRHEDSVQALREIVRKVTGKTPNKVSYRFYNNEENTRTATSINPIAYVVRFCDGAFNILAERVYKLPTEQALEDILAQYGKYNGDVYVRKNVGVCEVMDIDSTGSVINPSHSFIEVRDSAADLEKTDKLGSILQNIYVRAHETVHAAQVGSRLTWRTEAAFIMKFVCDNAIKLARSGKLEYESLYDSSHRNKMSGGKSRRQMLIDVLDTFITQSLGKGMIAQNVRKKGIYQGLWEKGISPVKEGTNQLNIEEIKKIPLERSTIRYYLARTRSALTRKDIGALEILYKELEDYSEELTAIIETMAEAYGLRTTKDIIKNLPDSRYGAEKKNRYYKSLVSNEVHRGILAQKFVDIWGSSGSYQERTRRLEEAGMRYRYVLNGNSSMPVRNLLNLGYNPLNPKEAYDDVAELYNRADKAGIPRKDVQEPMNAAKAMLGVRYATHIPLFMKVIDKYGAHKAFRKLLDAESMAEIKGWMK